MSDSQTSGRQEYVTPRFARAIAVLAMLLLVCAALLGGKSDAPPYLEAVLTIISIWIFTLLKLSDNGTVSAQSPVLRGAFWLLVATFAVIAVQLLPLPYSLWSSLTGSGAAKASLAAAGLADGWRPLTLDLYGTVTTAIAFLPAVAMFWAMVRLDVQDRNDMMIAIAVLGFFSILLGLLQFGSGSNALYLYDTSHDAFSTGFFSNRNHQSDLTLIAMLLASAGLRYRIDNPASRTSSSRRRKDAGQASGALAGLFQRHGLEIIFVAVLLVLAILNLFATASRTGLALMLPVLLCCGAIMFGLRKGGKPLFIGVIVLFILLLVLMSLRMDLMAEAIGRFESDDDLRFSIWPLTVDLIGQNAPMGSGLGSFVTVFAAHQPLEMMSNRYVNHAHNDYLEIALELGYPGVVLMLGFFGWLVWAVLDFMRKLRGSASAPARTGFAIAVIVAIGVCLFHTLADYSLRTGTLAVMFAAMLGYLMPLNPQAHPLFRRKHTSRRARTSDAA